MLQFHGVSFGYGSRTVLTATSFTLGRGTATALIGPNGAGKTSLLRLASGVLQPTAGSIVLDGQPLGGLSVRQAARIVAMVPQQLEVPFDYTVEEIVEQGRTPHLAFLRGLSAPDHRALDRALDLANLTALRRRVFQELSGGERQRVKIALGLAQEPRLLLLDEPTQNLDIGRQVELLDLLQHLRETGLTLFASMHELHLIPHNFANVLLLREAEPPLFGPPDRILERTLLETAFRCPPSRHPFFAQPTTPEGDPL